MIALDTNILVRFLTQDDPEQGRLASRLISQLSQTRPGFVCREVLVELVWVLERSYGFGRDAIARVLEGLLAATELVIEEADALGAILDSFRHNGFGFADLMIREAARRAGAQSLATFDRKATGMDGVSLVDSANTK